MVRRHGTRKIPGKGSGVQSRRLQRHDVTSNQTNRHAGSNGRFAAWTARCLPLLVFVAVTVALFSPWWHQGKVLAPLDIVTNLYEPWADPAQPVDVKNHFAGDAPTQYLLYHHHANRSYRTEGRWGWNDLKSCGTPEARNTMATPGDWSIQLHRIFSFWNAWHLGIMGHLLIAMLGMHQLLRAHGIRRDLCLLGGLAYGLNGLFFSWQTHRWMLGAFCWTPWWLWAANRLKERKRSGLLTPVFLALSLLGGHLQFAAYQLIILGIVACDGCLDTWRARYGILKPVVTAAVIGGIAFGLAAYALIPSIAGYLDTIAHGQVRGEIGYPSGIGGAVLHALIYPAYLYPFPLGTPDTVDLFKLFHSDLMDVPFFGSLLMLLSIIGLVQRRLPRTARLLVAAGLFLPLTPLAGPLYNRLFILWVLGGIWLSVSMLQTCDPVRWTRVRIRFLHLFLAGTFALAVAGLVVSLYRENITQAAVEHFVRQAEDHMFQARPDWFAGRAARFVAGWRPWRPAMAVPWLLFGASIFLLGCRRHRWFGYALAVVIGLQLYLYSQPRWIVFTEAFGPERSVLPETVETRALQRIVGRYGRVHVLQAPNRLPLFPPNTLSYFGIPAIEGYDSIQPDGMQDIPSATSDAAAFAKRGVTHIITFAGESPPGQGWVHEETIGRIAIHANRHPAGRYTAYGTNGSVRLPLHVEEHRHNSRRLNVPANTVQVRLRENWDTGWRYRVHGSAWQRASRDDHGGMYLTVPANSRPGTIELIFVPQWKKVGLLITLTVLMIYLPACLWIMKHGGFRPHCGTSTNRSRFRNTHWYSRAIPPATSSTARAGGNTS